MNTVHAIAIDKTRNIYVSDRANSRIQVFDENGKFLDAWPNVRRPYSLLLSEDQHLWVADGITQKFTKFDLTGKLLYSWGTFGAFPGGFWGVHQFHTDTRGQPLHGRRARRTAAEVPAEEGREPGAPRRRATSRGRARTDVAGRMRHRAVDRHSRAGACQGARGAEPRGPGGSALVPTFEVDPAWPQPLPDRWLVGAVAGVAVDARDHVWIVHRPGTLQPNETRSIWHAAPPVIEFDPAGNVVSRGAVLARATSGPTSSMASTSTTTTMSGWAAAGRKTRRS